MERRCVACKAAAARRLDECAAARHDGRHGKMHQQSSASVCVGGGGEEQQCEGKATGMRMRRGLAARAGRWPFCVCFVST